jgi:O-antigen biosynthesis protein
MTKTPKKKSAPRRSPAKKSAPRRASAKKASYALKSVRLIKKLGTAAEPEFCVFTPVHAAGSLFLREAYDSLRAQTRVDWEWRILENNGGHVDAVVRADPRVTVLTLDDDRLSDRIGALKRHLCTTGQPRKYYVELDCDDVLHETALEKIGQAFEGGADFVYSDCAQWMQDPTGKIKAEWPGNPYPAAYGWESYPVTFRGARLHAQRAPAANAHNLRMIWWAPNHVRAWTRAAYEKIGGHDVTMPVADDHDLMIRFYLAGCRMVHLPWCLYFYRVHETNTVKVQNAAIQNGSWNNFARYIYRLAEKFSDDHKLLNVDLCGGTRPYGNYLVLDKRVPSESVGVECDLEQHWQLPDQSVGVLRANCAIEHLRDPVHTMNEAHRVLAPGGFFIISVPSTSGKGAFCDPTHVSYWNDLSFRYYTDQHFAFQFVPEFKGRFQMARCMEWFPDKWHKDNNVPYVDVVLIRLGPGYEPMGEVKWPSRHG